MMQSEQPGRRRLAGAAGVTPHIRSTFLAMIWSTQMALKAMTLTAGPNATNGQFGFRVTSGTEENPKSGKLTFTDKPQRIELLSQLAKKVGLERQLAELVRAKYLTLVSKEEADAKGQK